MAAIHFADPYEPGIAQLIAVSAADGKERRTLYTVPPGSFISDYTVSPDATTVWFVTAALPPLCGPSSPTKPTPTAPPSTASGAASTSVAPSTTAPEQTTTTWPCYQGRQTPGQDCGAISSVPIAGGPVTPLRTSGLSPVGTYYAYSPRISPNGRFVAYARELCQGTGLGFVNFDLVITDLTTGTDHVLAHAPAPPDAWSPDSQTLMTTGPGEFHRGAALFNIAPDGTPRETGEIGTFSGCRIDVGAVAAVGWDHNTGWPIVIGTCDQEGRIDEIDRSGRVVKTLVQLNPGQVLSTASTYGDSLLVESTLGTQPGATTRLEEVVNGVATPLPYVQGRIDEQW